ncbi:hypothetical protein LEM8419_01557 [Neolewinella maritima]|uniref:Secretion system C-terminal sorting domain-containing protein n=1 Tax=Neolewinella maritima TaxID=1383882 RepID=A0ABM9B178_9BACT|nr:T9SS type A sorting domain-containing protein [Neolewinella maritima]CAH1000404.1 hypothetical protein LEM8419_01557 [Neolewinella maritima]
MSVGLCLLLACGTLSAQSFTGDVLIQTQADLDAFEPSPTTTYDTLVGNFDIDPIEPLTDFSNVATLAVITEDLGIDNYEDDQTIGNPLAQFTALDSVGRIQIFDIDNFNSGITTLSNSTLRLVGSTFEISSNQNVSGQVNLPALTSVGASYVVQNNPLVSALVNPILATIGGDFRIINNDALTNLDDFEQIANYSGDFIVTDNGTLSNIDGFANAGTIRFFVPVLRVSNNPTLETLGGTPGPNVIRLSVTDELQINNNSALTEISTEINAGVQGGDVTLTEISVQNNPLLETIVRIFDRSYNITVGNYLVADNAALNNLGGQPINVTGTIQLQRNNQITMGANFAPTTGLTGSLTIADNAQLGTFGRLGGTTDLTNGLRTVAGAITINNLPVLFSLEGLRRLTNAASLTLNGTGAISDLAGLRSLDELVDFLTVTNNSSLSDCCEIACEVIVAGQAVDGTNSAVTISGNTGGCEDKPTFVSNCAGEPGKGCLAAAPVEFIAFTGSLGNGYIDLDFATATESDNDYFQIERSVDGGSYTAIGRLAGAGNSLQEVTYSFRDFDYSAGVNYYRIRQVDFDGTEAFSDVIVVDAGGSSTAITLFPNPATGSEVTLQLGNDWNTERVTAQIFTVSGQLVTEIRAAGNTRLKLPTAGLQAGVYAVRVSDGGHTVTQRLTVR